MRRIDDTSFRAEWMMRMEEKQCHAVGWFSIEFHFTFSGFRKIDLHVQESDSLFSIGECVFDDGADSIHECHQGVKLGVGTQENEENVINKTFPKVHYVEESQDYGAFFFSHEQIDTGAAILVPMEIPRIWCICVSMNLKVLCLTMKLSTMRTIWSGGQFVGSRCFYSSMK